MSRSTGPVLAVGAITMARDVIVDGLDVDWRVPVATGAAAVGFALLERAWEGLAVGLAWLALVTVLLTRLDPGKPSPAEAFADYLKGPS